MFVYQLTVYKITYTFIVKFEPINHPVKRGAGIHNMRVHLEIDVGGVYPHRVFLFKDINWLNKLEAFTQIFISCKLSVVIYIFIGGKQALPDMKTTINIWDYYSILATVFPGNVS